MTDETTFTDKDGIKTTWSYWKEKVMKKGFFKQNKTSFVTFDDINDEDFTRRHPDDHDAAKKLICLYNLQKK